MAWIKPYETKDRRNGKPVKSYIVIWKEPARDAFGLPIPADPNRPNGRKKQVQQQETYPNREAAEARRDELNAARHTTGTSALAEARKAGDLPFGYYAKAWLDSLEVKVKQGRLKQSTLDGYAANLQRYALKTFSSKAIAAITPHDCEEFLAALVRQKSRQGADGQLDNTLTPATVKHGWGTFRRVLKYAVRHDAISSNPADRVDFDTNRATGDHEGFEHNPLTATQVAQLSAAVAGEMVSTASGTEVTALATPDSHSLPGYPIYGLMVDFLAYTGLRASENAGLEVRDLEFHLSPNVIRCSVHIRRTKTRKNTGTPGRSEWVTSTPKSKRSKRTVPLPPWLAARMYAYIHGGSGSDPAIRHGRSAELTAPLWPSRQNGGGYRRAGQRYAVPLDWSQPMAMGAFYYTIFRPALLALGLPASAPEVPATENTPAIPATRGVRLHDLRHTFAVMQLMAGTHYMQVSKWLGHSTFTLTLNTYGDWIPEEEGGAGNNLPEPPRALGSAPGQRLGDTAESAAAEPVPSNVVPLFGRRSAG
ncbi:site-specific integrase [Nocardia otitidiscaviarum]|uniref:tyrosine-type recombinase/integrase n=1 Tax=Nocardia otitidiscaviarum TaxID=1823 RepID=UPI00189324D0|nr:site-specific integrase [Nocardia otitidiscaviarum]MBF6131603.1 site-specific integrase [Nocardia otitidiscaviarum]